MSRLTRDGTAEPVSRDQILRHARGQGNVHFPCSADHEQDWQPYPVDPYSAICDDHTYIHTPHATLNTTIHAFRPENNVGVSTPLILPKKSPMEIQLRRSHLIQKKTVRMVKKESKGSLLLYRSYPPPPWSPFVISDLQVERVVL